MPYKKAIQWMAEWVLKEKRRRRPQSLYLLGIQGSIGRGKTTFSRYLANTLNTLLSPSEGCAVSQSLDDYYLPRALRARAAFRRRGYAPKAVSNRGPAGTHDLPLLWKNIRAMEGSSPWSTLELPAFDKRTDDRAPERRCVAGAVGILILEGWFVGAEAPRLLPRELTGLRRSVAIALRRYQPLFRRLDALLAFDTPPVPQILGERLAQENSREAPIGMTARQIRSFVRYFYVESWQPGLTSPIPPDERISWRVSLDRGRRSMRYFST